MSDPLLCDAPPADEASNPPPPDEPPYSPRNELHYFLTKGVPPCLSAFLEWGFPPLFTMFMAGQTPDSRRLQSALLYGRTFYNVTLAMTGLGLTGYLRSVIPGCIGAGRKDRIPHYFWRSLLLITLCCLPLYALTDVPPLLISPRHVMSR